MDCFFVQTPLLLGQLIVLTDNPEVKVALPREGSFCPTEKTCVSMAKGLRKGMYFFVMTTFNPNKTKCLHYFFSSEATIVVLLLIDINSCIVRFMLSDEPSRKMVFPWPCSAK